MELSKEQRRWIYIIAGIILVLFVVGLMLKFWGYTIVAIGCFGFGYYYGRTSGRDKEGKEKKGLF